MALNFTPIQFFDGDDPVRASNPTDPTIDAAYFNSREAYLASITNEINTLDHYSHLGQKAATYTDWTLRDPSTLISSTSTAPVDDAGNTFNYTVTSSSYTCVKRNGGLQGLLPGTASGASYLTVPCINKVKRLGMKVGFGPGGDSNVTCGVTMIAWDTSIPSFGVSQAQCHFTLSPGAWSLDLVYGGTINNVAGSTFATPLSQDYTPHTVELCIYGNTLTLALPDGKLVTVPNTHIGSIQGTYACWEFFKNSGNGFDQVLFDCWADTKPMPSDGMSMSNVGRLIVRAINVLIAQPYPPTAVAYL